MDKTLLGKATEKAREQLLTNAAPLLFHLVTSLFVFDMFF